MRQKIQPLIFLDKEFLYSVWTVCTMHRHVQLWERDLLRGSSYWVLQKCQQAYIACKTGLYWNISHYNPSYNLTWYLHRNQLKSNWPNRPSWDVNFLHQVSDLDKIYIQLCIDVDTFIDMAGIVDFSTVLVSLESWRVRFPLCPSPNTFFSTKG